MKIGKILIFLGLGGISLISINIFDSININISFPQQENDTEKQPPQERVQNTKRNLETPRRSSPEPALRNYYQALNNYKYQSAWNSLSSKEQSEGYNSYIEWWTRIKRIEVLSTKLVSEDRFNSTVESRLRYFAKSGREINQIIRFNFVWDTGSDCWLINKIEPLALLD
ncbi:MAG: hypothetical protein F6K54_07460 [Okeania sp. SIO3B5]|uniref:hypothetical protein n=1 Tax=Okeania sp. SIO3B5 TaxID=2607811 RepID=UPI0014016F73|nr:hypothetical protein [Okeania sp. SIO3B5]NEO52929.1 hypothetical protein [Okeania sp. SIO3B5]